MKVKKYSEINENASNGFLKIFKKLGFDISNNGDIKSNTKFSKLFCEMAVIDGYLEKEK